MRIVLLPLGLFVIAIVGVAMIQSGLITGGDNTLITNESWTPSTGSYVALEDSNLDNAYYGNDTVVYNTTGTDAVEQEQGVDYLWNKTDGTVSAVAGAGLENATSATITYEYQQTTAEEERLAGMLAQIPRVAGVMLPIFGIVFLFLFVRGA